MTCNLGKLEFEKTKRKHRGWIISDFRASHLQQNSTAHWPELLRWFTLLIEVPKLSRLAIINGVPFGCPSGTMNKRVLKKNGRWNLDSTCHFKSWIKRSLQPVRVPEQTL